jgi:parallel beta-helix repeat protein
MKTPSHSRLSATSVALAAVITTLALGQGTLTPPGAPAPTMKSLAQVEPRIDVASLSGDSSNLYIINIPGSYYLTGNITGVSGKNGISIQANNVTLDLNGFEVVGVAGTVRGVTTTGTFSQATIRNGSVSNWGDAGIEVGNSCQVSHVMSALNRYGIFGGNGVVVTECTLQGNGSSGIEVGNDAVVSESTAQGGNVGIFTGFGAVVTRCTAQGNVSGGIYAAAGSTIADCTVRANGNLLNAASGIQFAGDSAIVSRCNCYNNTGPGIQVVNRSRVSDCAVSGNGANTSGGGIVGGSVVKVSGCTVGSNTGIGINLSDNALVCDCNVNFNSVDGVRVTNFSIVKDCAIGDNSSGGGVDVIGGHNRIEGNNLTHNSLGIWVQGTANVIFRNSASANGADYAIVPGNRYGQIVDATAFNINGVDGAGAASSALTTDPWANFSY